MSDAVVDKELTGRNVAGKKAAGTAKSGTAKSGSARTGAGKADPAKAGTAAAVSGQQEPREAQEPQEPDEFAVQIGDQIESFILSVREVAKGDDPDSAVPYLLLEVSQLLLAGGRLGAHEDMVPDERYEPDVGPRAGRGRPAAAAGRAAGADRRVLRGLRPVRAAVHAGGLPDLGRPGRRRGRPRARAGPLQGRAGLRGAVVVAVLVPVQLGLHGQRVAARAPVAGGARPAGQPAGRAGRPGHRAPTTPTRRSWPRRPAG